MTVISSLKNSQIKETQPARNEEIRTGMNWRLKKCRVNFSLQIFIHWSGAVACFFNNTLLYCQKLLKRILNIFSLWVTAQRYLSKSKGPINRKCTCVTTELLLKHEGGYHARERRGVLEKG